MNIESGGHMEGFISYVLATNQNIHQHQGSFSVIRSTDSSHSTYEVR